MAQDFYITPQGKVLTERQEHERQAERRRLAHEYVIAVVNAGKILGSPTSHVGLHKPAEDAQHGLSYADALIAATTPESEAKS